MTANCNWPATAGPTLETARRRITEAIRCY